jgi:hypothetical protein
MHARCFEGRQSGHVGNKEQKQCLSVMAWVVHHPPANESDVKAAWRVP